MRNQYLPVSSSQENLKILAAKLDIRKQFVVKKIAYLTVKTVPSPNSIGNFFDYLDDWESINFDDKYKMLDNLINRIRATGANVEIEWKI